MWGNGGGMWFGGPVMWILWIVLIAGVVWLFRNVAGGRRDTPPPAVGDDPRVILERRFARGEIDEAEFRRRRAELER